MIFFIVIVGITVVRASGSVVASSARDCVTPAGRGPQSSEGAQARARSPIGRQAIAAMGERIATSICGAGQCDAFSRRREWASRIRQAAISIFFRTPV